MSRQAPEPIDDTAAEAMEGWADQLQAVWQRFRDGRLYVQVILSLVLLGATLVVAAGPAERLGRVRTWLTWTTHHDYDFAGQAARADAWARARGGWGPAAAGVWKTGQKRVQGWAERVRPTSAPAAAPPAPATAASAPASSAPAIPGSRPALAPTPDSSVWVLPVADAKILYGYGWLPKAVSDQLHEGIDFAAPVGTTVVAVSDGTITRIAADPQLGYFIEVKHGTLTATYAQVTTIRVQKGDQVRRGQALAAVASPFGIEQAMPPHLHFAVRPAGKQTPVDPAFYLGLGGNKH